MKPGLQLAAAIMALLTVMAHTNAEGPLLLAIKEHPLTRQGPTIHVQIHMTLLRCQGDQHGREVLTRVDNLHLPHLLT
jgi:hypothetical protein